MATYKFNGPKNPAVDNTEIIDMGDGRVARVGDEIELSDEEKKNFSGLKLSKSDDSEDSDVDDGTNANTGASAPTQTESSGYSSVNTVRSSK